MPPARRRRRATAQLTMVRNQQMFRQSTGIAFHGWW
jgi:hypothetical protein